MSEHFPKPTLLAANVKVQLDFSNYITKADLKHATDVNTLELAKETV